MLCFCREHVLFGYVGRLRRGLIQRFTPLVGGRDHRGQDAHGGFRTRRRALHKIVDKILHAAVVGFKFGPGGLGEVGLDG